MVDHMDTPVRLRVKELMNEKWLAKVVHIQVLVHHSLTVFHLTISVSVIEGLQLKSSDTTNARWLIVTNLMALKDLSTST